EELGAEVSPASGRQGKDDRDDEDDHHHLQHRKRKLKVAGLADADVIQPRDENGGQDRHQVAVIDRKYMAGADVPGEQWEWKKTEGRKITQHPHDPSSNSSDGGGLGDQEPRPGIEKAGQWTVAVANVDVFPTG